LKEDILVQLHNQLNIQMEIRFGGADGASGIKHPIQSSIIKFLTRIISTAKMSTLFQNLEKEARKKMTTIISSQCIRLNAPPAGEM